MNKLNKAIKSFPLFLLCAVACGACAGTISVKNDELLPKEVATQKELIVYGDYDRLFSAPGQHKTIDGKAPIRELGDYAQHMDYNEAGYYETIIQLKAGDQFILQNVSDNKFIKYSNNINNSLFTSKDGNICVGQDGIYHLKYDANFINESNQDNLNNGWKQIDKVDLPERNIYFKYDKNVISSPDIPDENINPGLELIKGDLKITGWFEKPQEFTVENGYYKADVSVAFANGYKTLIHKWGNTSYESERVDLSVLDYTLDDTKLYMTIHNDSSQGKPSVTLDQIYQRTFVNDYRFKPNMARVWLDRGLSFDPNAFIPVFTIYQNDSVIQRYFPVEEVNIKDPESNPETNERKVVYYDIDTKYFTSSYHFNIAAYKLADEQLSHGCPQKSMSELKPSEMIYVTGMENKISFGNATNNDNKLNTTQFAKVLEGYFTCSSSKLNGYGDFNTLRDSWCGADYSRLVDFASSEVKMNDFKPTTEWENEYQSGERKTPIFVTDKINAMSTLANNSNPINSIMDFDENSSIAFIIIGVSLIAVIGSVLLITIKRRKARI